MRKKQENRISYVKKTFAPGSILSLCLSGAALLLFCIGMYLAVATQGNIPAGGTAVCFSSFLFSLMGMRYGFISLKEKDRKYILAKISIGIGGALGILWLVMILIGIKYL